MPQQAEADRALVGRVRVGMLVAAPRLLLNNPGGRDEAEATDGDQSGGQQHPEAAHAAEHAGGVGQRAQIEHEPGFFFLLLPVQHLPPSLPLTGHQQPAEHLLWRAGLSEVPVKWARARWSPQAAGSGTVSTRKYEHGDITVKKCPLRRHGLVQELLSSETPLQLQRTLPPLLPSASAK